MCLLGSLVAEGEHPAEGAEDRFLAPAAGGAATFDGAHLLDESTDDGEQEVETQCPADELGHGASLGRCRGDGPSLIVPKRALGPAVASRSTGPASKIRQAFARLAIPAAPRDPHPMATDGPGVTRYTGRR